MIPIIISTLGLHVGSPCNFKKVYMRVQQEKGGRGAGFGGWGGGDLTQPPVNFSKFLVFFFLSVTWRPAKGASVRSEQTSGKCSSGYNDVNTSGYRGLGGMP